MVRSSIPAEQPWTSDFTSEPQRPPLEKRPQFHHSRALTRIRWVNAGDVLSTERHTVCVSQTGSIP